MTITFYAARLSSAVPVSCALKELDIPHQRIEIDLKSGALKKPEFLALNPNAKVPTLVVDGTPMFESVAIVQWLGDRYGVKQGLWPAADAPARMTALAWTAWAYVTFAATLQRRNMASSPHVDAKLHNAAQAEQANAELQQLLGIVDAHLAKREYMLGASYTLVDLVVAGMFRYAAMTGVSTDAHPRVKDWIERCFARPGLTEEWT